MWVTPFSEWRVTHKSTRSYPRLSTDGPGQQRTGLAPKPRESPLYLDSCERLRKPTLCRGRESNPYAVFTTADFKSAASTISPPRQGCNFARLGLSGVSFFGERRHSVDKFPASLRAMGRMFPVCFPKSTATRPMLAVLSRSSHGQRGARWQSRTTSVRSTCIGPTLASDTMLRSYAIKDDGFVSKN